LNKGGLFFYQLYGLNARSELCCPELLAGDASSEQVANIDLRFAEIDAAGLEDPLQSTLFTQTSPQKFWMNVDGLAHFLVLDGCQILIDPVDGADEQSIRLYVLGSCMGALLQQRQFLVLHANALAVGDKAVVFAGPSGIGKSTLAGIFHQRGYPVLTDDVCAINTALEIVPGYPQIKLWHDSAQQLNIETTELRRIRLQVNKYAVPLHEGFATTAYPVAAVFFLHSHNEAGIKIEPAKGWECYRPLKANTYRMAYVKGMGLEKQHLKQCSQLSNQASMWHVYRPDRGFELEAMLHALDMHFKRIGLIQ